jgi:hypothetical protein
VNDLSRETWEIVTKQDIDRLEMQLAMQCAPLLTGLKISNLLNISREDFEWMKRIIRHSKFSWFLLLETEENVSVLLFHREGLENYLKKEQVVQIFMQAGYQDLSLGAILREFAVRYRRYRETKCDFPHEMGLLLGYPTEDVEGFIHGDDCLCSGYWKVYADKEKKLKLFERFEYARERLIRLLSSGVGMIDIIDMCCSGTCCSQIENAVQIN